MSSQSSSTPKSQNSLTTNEALQEASEASIDELMNRTPTLSDSEIDRITEYLRAHKVKFAQQEAQPKPKKAPRQKGPIFSADELLKAMDLE
jgi:hypothetical protein